jgi:hypothetical protein
MNSIKDKEGGIKHLSSQILQMGDFQKNEDFSFSENNLNIK